MEGETPPTWTKKYLANGFPKTQVPFCNHSDPLTLINTLSTEGFKKLADSFIVSYKASVNPSTESTSASQVSDLPSSFAFEKMKLAELRSHCLRLKISSTGSRQLLIDRLLDHQTSLDHH